MLERTRLESPIDVFVKMNTGMNRLGFAPARFGAAVERLRGLSSVRSITLMTHFASADEDEGVAAQLAVFDAHVAPFGGLRRSLANSAALLRYPQTHADCVRPGIMLYGVSPFAGQPAAALGLRPAMALESELIAVQSIEAGQRVGYAGAFRADAPMRVGIVACGYADGYPRHAPTGTPVLVDLHAEATSEKIAMGLHLDGRVAAVVGTHTHVQTADEQIFPGGTAFLCDAGMCGAADSILGRTKESILRRFLTGMPTTLPVAGGEVLLCGVMVEVDEATGRAMRIKRVQEKVTPSAPEGGPGENLL
jgi:alanine racemase